MLSTVRPVGFATSEVALVGELGISHSGYKVSRSRNNCRVGNRPLDGSRAGANGALRAARRAGDGRCDGVLYLGSAGDGPVARGRYSGSVRPQKSATAKAARAAARPVNLVPPQLENRHGRVRYIMLPHYDQIATCGVVPMAEEVGGAELGFGKDPLAPALQYIVGEPASALDDSIAKAGSPLGEELPHTDFRLWHEAERVGTV